LAALSLNIRDVVDIRSSSGHPAALLRELVDEVGPLARGRLGALEGEAFLARLEQVHTDVAEPLEFLYGDRTDPAELVRELVGVALDAAAGRPWPLRVADRRREVDPAWFQRSELVGYACYADRFGGTLAGVRERLDYLAELGVTYLHLMPLLATRPGPNDGGYAVVDYSAVDPRLGSMADLEALAGDLRSRGIALCVDLVLNHTAREHQWARRAAAGDPAYRDFYLVFPDRTLPDAYERTLPEVFPDTAPGNFTHVPELGGWVWTTFNDYQWDLDYSNPAVFAAMLRTMLDLANRGADVLRLDAAPFLWKRMGTDCQNQPEAHLLVQAYRALTRLAAPGVLFKAEAIVAPDMLVQYLGAHDRYRPECDLAYHNQLMVLLWSSLATRDARLATRALSRLRPAPAPAGWVTYLRCHDDIGWAVSDEDAAAVGWNGFDHRRFLAGFYAGLHPGSFAQGELFQENEATGDARTSGTAAALCGITAGDPAAVDRLETLYSVVFSFGGIPLLWMGDELGLGNDPRWADDPLHADDNRWLHRPPMDWPAAARRTDPETVEGQVFRRLRALAAARKGQLALRSGGETTVLAPDDPNVLAYRRRHQRSAPLLALANFSEGWQSVEAGLAAAAGIAEPVHVHSTRGRLDLGEGRIHLPPWGFAWLTTR
jgi:amylosucrase